MSISYIVYDQTSYAGHYVVRCFNAVHKGWMEYSDVNVHTIPLSHIVNEKAYLLFYRIGDEWNNYINLYSG